MVFPWGMGGFFWEARFVQITRHFSRREFDCPQPAPLGTPFPKTHLARLRRLCAVLETVREHLGGHPMIITSGYRTRAYNRSVGGSKNSRHLTGDACDFVVRIPRLILPNVYWRIRHLIDDGVLPRRIGLGGYEDHIHLDVRPTTRLVTWTRFDAPRP